MKVINIYNIFRNDCTMDCECEHCGHVEVDNSAYNDNYYIKTVVPNRHCKNCGQVYDPSNNHIQIAL